MKHFEIDVAPEVVRRLETRVLIRQEGGWEGYTYRWDEAGVDAELLSGAETDTFTVEDPAAPGGVREQSWYFPSSTDCLSCHTLASDEVLGVRTRQLNRGFHYPAVTDNQLRAWNHIGLFDQDIGDERTYESLADPSDDSRPLRERARSYLAANCSQCHLPGGPTPVDLDLRFGVPTADMNAVGVPSVNDPSTLRIDPGSKETSVLWDVLGRLDDRRMPPLASHLVDPLGREVVGQWIDAGAP